MSFVSYTRNFEDVMINRAMQGIEKGFYVDVGGFHPVVDSNTYALYKNGWRGIALEPQANLHPMWLHFRPEDTLVGAAAGAQAGELPFFEISEVSQCATFSPELAQAYRDKNYKLSEPKTIPVVTLNQVLADLHPSGEIHCMSIDVEGFEGQVLQGLDRTRFRPWLMVLESVVPGSPNPNHQGWEPMLLESGYDFVYFDGANRFYVAKEHAELKRHFQVPPCVWDDFVNINLVSAREEIARLQAVLQSYKTGQVAQ